MKQILLVLSILFVNNLAQANIAGDWIGWGDWTFQGSGDHCDMHLVFKESETSFQRTKGVFSCSMVVQTLPEQKWTKKGSALLADGIQVGTISENHAEYTEQYSENVSIFTTIHTEARHIDYHEVWSEKDGKVIYDITGRLFRHDD